MNYAGTGTYLPDEKSQNKIFSYVRNRNLGKIGLADWFIEERRLPDWLLEERRLEKWLSDWILALIGPQIDF